MPENRKSHLDLEALAESQLNLQTKISYSSHHDFLLRHGLASCSAVLDIGTGNGAFVARLAEDHPATKWVGIDKRKHCIERCQHWDLCNLNFFQVDLFTRESDFDFSRYDGFLMRYFLLHVDHAHKILTALQSKAKPGSRFWVIDLDFSQFTCSPPHPAFEQLTQLVKDFCAKTSIDSMGGQRVLPLFQTLKFKNISIENIPFSAKTIPLEDFVLYLRQEIQCYSRMIGRSIDDAETEMILKFLDEEVRIGNFEVSYGMVLLSAEN